MTFDVALKIFNPLFMIYASSLFIKLLLFLSLCLSVAGIIVCAVMARSKAPYTPGNFVHRLTQFGPLLSLMGILYALYVQFIVMPPILAAEHVPITLPVVWPSVNDALVSVMAGLPLFAIGVIGDRILRKQKT